MTTEPSTGPGDVSFVAALWLGALCFGALLLLTFQPDLQQAGAMPPAIWHRSSKRLP